jgi:hypothetical protein
MLPIVSQNHPPVCSEVSILLLTLEVRFYRVSPISLFLICKSFMLSADRKSKVSKSFANFPPFCQFDNYVQMLNTSESSLPYGVWFNILLSVQGFSPIPAADRPHGHDSDSPQIDWTSLIEVMETRERGAVNRNRAPEVRSAVCAHRGGSSREFQGDESSKSGHRPPPVPGQGSGGCLR